MGAGMILAHEIDAAGALDLAGQFAVQPSGDASEAARKDFAGLSGEFSEVFGLFVIHHFHFDIITAARHALVMLAEVDEALRGLRLHDVLNKWAGGRRLADFPVFGAALQERVEFDFFQPAGGAHAFFVAGGDVAGRRGALGAGLGAFEDDDIAWHDFTGKVRRWERGRSLVRSFGVSSPFLNHCLYLCPFRWSLRRLPHRRPRSPSGRTGSGLGGDLR